MCGWTYVPSLRKATLGPKDADGYSTVTSKDKRVRVRNVCLPDGTDPRGPKGK